MKIAELIEKCSKGDKQCWGALVKTYYPFAFFLADRWLTPCLVDEGGLRQTAVNTFDTLSKNNMAGLKAFPAGTSFPVYFRQAVYEACLAFCEKHSIVPRFHRLADREALAAASEGLPPAETVALRLYVLAHMSISQAAEIAGVANAKLVTLVGSLAGPEPGFAPSAPEGQPMDPRPEDPAIKSGTEPLGDQDGKGTQRL